MNKKTDNHFPHIEQFKEAVANLPELRSITGNAYPVKRTLSDKGGEAMVLLCASPDGTDVVAKVYYELNDPSDNYIIPRANVLKFMGTEEGKRYTLAISEIGFVEFGNSQYLFEIMPYCRSTDLSDDGAYSFDQIVDVAKQMNELLHSIHNVGICHLDIKPENMYMFDGQIKLGDFGIARNAANNRSNMTVHIMGTEGYRAPEATRYIFGPASDYYSLGVTLASLFEGHFIFENMNYEMQVKALENERVPLTKMDPHREQLENLLNGLVRINPRQRFGYDDVKRWIEDHNYIGGVQSDEWPKSFRLLNDIYKDEKSMFFGITKDSEHWDMAKKMLYGNIIEPFFSSFRTDLAMAAKSVNELYRSSNGDKGLAVFLKSLYKPGPIVWRGHHFYSLGELGARMLVTKNQAGYSELLKNNCVSHWLTNTEGISKNNDTLELVNSIEMLANSAPELACYWFGNSFASERELNICNRTVKTIDELIKTLFSSNSNFFQLGGYEKLMNRVDGADLYGFLYSFGYKDIIDAEWQNVKELPTYESTVVLMSMMDVIAVKAGADAGIVRSFFINYGPVGIARYVKKLTEENVYSPLDFEGKQIIEKVTNCSTPKEGTVDQLYKAYLPLIDSVRKMQSKLIENPHCIISGMYETKGIICKNLAGCFAFKIYDRLAPLGFSYLIESNNGGV